MQQNNLEIENAKIQLKTIVRWTFEKPISVKANEKNISNASITFVNKKQSMNFLFLNLNKLRMKLKKLADN